VPLKILHPLIENCSLEKDDSLQEKWAALLANAANPAPPNLVLPAFAEILKQLSPIEAALLERIYSEIEAQTNDSEYLLALGFDFDDILKNYCQILGLASEHEVAAQEATVRVLVSNLIHLGLIEYIQDLEYLPERMRPRFPAVTAEQLIFTHLGEAFIKACRAPARATVPIRWDWGAHARNWDPKRVITELGVEGDVLEKMHDEIRSEASLADPLQDWYELVEFVSVEQS
jgi:hypothetical protein